MLKKCKICGSTFKAKGNKKYCSEICRKKAYKNYKYYTDESLERYRDRIKEENGFSDSDFNYEFRERTAANRGMSTSEYNKYLEERKARRLGLSLKELRHCTYISKKTGDPLYMCIGMKPEEYYERLKQLYFMLDGN